MARCPVQHGHIGGGHFRRHFRPARPGHLLGRGRADHHQHDRRRSHRRHVLVEHIAQRRFPRQSRHGKSMKFFFLFVFKSGFLRIDLIVSTGYWYIGRVLQSHRTCLCRIHRALASGPGQGSTHRNGNFGKFFFTS